MTMLVFGKTGQVARALARLAPDATYLGRAEADLTDPAACAAAIARLRPRAVINAAAYTAVDQAESDAATARAVNATSPGAMAAACAVAGIPLVHLSTDYVFDGEGDGTFAPDAPVAPLNVYGRTKEEGETLIRASGATHAILRTAWVFSADGSHFVKTMLRLSETRDRISVVADQYGGPTPASALAAACLTVAARLTQQRGLAGTYHLTGGPDVSRAEFARTIFDLAGRRVTVEETTTDTFPTPARRPLNARLDCTATEQAFGIPRPDWRAGLADVLKTLEGAI